MAKISKEKVIVGTGILAGLSAVILGTIKVVRDRKNKK